MRSRLSSGIGLRIAAAALVVAAVAMAILAVGVVVVGSQVFASLMATHGVSEESSQSMFRDSVVVVLIIATLVAVLVAIGLAAIVAPRLARPLRDIGAAARRIADGHYESRIPRRGPEEIVSLADSFNQMAASLEEQERMRQEFIANAAHELRTPLTNLTGYLEALRDGVMEPDRATFESLLEEAGRLVRLARSLDQLAEGDAAAPPELVDLDLASVILSAVDLVRPAMVAAGLVLAVDVPGSLPARGNADQLAQVLGNLLQNALRYTQPGGRVDVRARRRPADLLVSVSNTGEPIPATDLGRVFERFYRVEKSRDRAHGGAGIGLSIVKQLVEGHGGSVGADSSDGAIRFWFSLPA